MASPAAGALPSSIENTPFSARRKKAAMVSSSRQSMVEVEVVTEAGESMMRNTANMCPDTSTRTTSTRQNVNRSAARLARCFRARMKISMIPKSANAPADCADIVPGNPDANPGANFDANPSPGATPAFRPSQAGKTCAKKMAAHIRVNRPATSTLSLCFSSDCCASESHRLNAPSSTAIPDPAFIHCQPAGRFRAAKGSSDPTRFTSAMAATRISVTRSTAASFTSTAASGSLGGRAGILSGIICEPEQQ
jgi:hypothetical protein